MRMSMKWVVICSFAMAVGLTVLGWVAYPALVALALPGTAAGVVAASPEGAFMHRVWSVAPLFPMGLALGVSGRFVGDARHSARAYGRGVLGFLVIGVVVLLVGLVLVAPASMATSPVDGMPQPVRLPLDALPLWKAGVGALVAVIVCGLMAALGRRRRLG